MKILRFLSIVTLSIAAVTSSLLAADDENHEALIDEIITKARATLGSEEDLKNVKTIRLKGAILYGTGNTGTIDVIYKKPYYHLLSSVVDDVIEISGLDDAEAWVKSGNTAAPNDWNLLILDAEQVFNMRARVSETLNFYARPTARGTEVLYEGETEVDGHQCHALVYHHGDGIWYLHYFDKESGRIVKVVNNKGIEYYEKGEIIVDGIRFPKKLISVYYTAKGRGTMEISYTEIKINEKFDNEIFAMPSLTK